MLSKLIIQNFAIIDQLEITFHEDLSIITGETGAGKSIILGALGLLLLTRRQFLEGIWVNFLAMA